jgi:curved DNA-binding protein CbpA
MGDGSNARTLYEILGVDDKASRDVIVSQYRRLAVEHHPDRNPDDPRAAERFIEINEAYETLSDPGRRAEYNLEISGGRRADRLLTSFASWRLHSRYFPQPKKAPAPGLSTVEAAPHTHPSEPRWSLFADRGGEGHAGGPNGDRWVVSVPRQNIAPAKSGR